MNLPSFCYQKAFWAILGILFVILGSVLAYSQQIDARQDEQLYEHQKILAERADAISKIDRIYENLIILCVRMDADCK